MWLTYILTSTFFIFCILPLAFCNYVMHLNHQLFRQKYLVLFTNLFCDMLKSLFLEKSTEGKYLSCFSLKKLASDWLAELIDQSGAQFLVGKCLNICPPSMPFSKNSDFSKVKQVFHIYLFLYRTSRLCNNPLLDLYCPK